MCNTYISDITSQSDRTARISLLDAFVMLAMPFGNLIGARLYLHLGYYVTFAASGFFAFSGAVYVALVLRETVVRGSKDEKEKQSICQVNKNKIPSEMEAAPRYKLLVHCSQCFYYSNCFKLLEQSQVCLNIDKYC